MNFCGFSFDSETRGQVSRLAQSGRLPHAVIIESKSEEQAKNLAALLSAYAVCESEDKPLDLVHLEKRLKKMLE